MADIMQPQTIMGNLPIEEIRLQSAIKRRVIYFDDVITDNTAFLATYFIDRIIDIDKRNEVEDPEPITIRLNTPGGYVTHGFALIGRIQEAQKAGYKIHIIAEGQIASMGIPLLAIADKRVAHRFDRFMIHNISSGTQGNLEQMKVDIKDIEELQGMFNEIYEQYTKLPKDILEAKKYGDWHFSAADALKYGIIDEII